MDRKTTATDLTQGPLLIQVLRFSVPIILTSFLQLLFNAADMAIAGQFIGDYALGAVGATTFLVNGFVNFLVGISVGANVVIARCFGMRAAEQANRSLHAAIALGLAGGLLLMAAGLYAADFAMTVLDTPEELKPFSVQYLRIYFLGLPVMAVFNLCTAALRSIGDTKHPLYFLGTAGACNLFLNVFFVVILQIGVAGVALGTVLSQLLACLLVLRFLSKGQAGLKFQISKLNLEGRYVREILWVGLPAGIQSIIFSVSNMMIQAGYNSFGSDVVSGNSAAGTIEQFVYATMNAFGQAAVSFIGQNVGAGDLRRVRNSLGVCLLWCNLFGITCGWLTVAFARPLLSIFSPEPAVIEGGYGRILFVCGTYFLCGSMDVVLSCLRGLGNSLQPMLLSIFGICGLRILWVRTVFPVFQTLESLYIAYPISWSGTLLVELILFYRAYRRLCTHNQMCGPDV